MNDVRDDFLCKQVCNNDHVAQLASYGWRGDICNQQCGLLVQPVLCTEWTLLLPSRLMTVTKNVRYNALSRVGRGFVVRIYSEDALVTTCRGSYQVPSPISINLVNCNSYFPYLPCSPPRALKVSQEINVERCKQVGWWVVSYKPEVSKQVKMIHCQENNVRI